MNPFFPEIKKKFGFGFMRLPMKEDQIDLARTKGMVDAFLSAGFNYFDTAHPYFQGGSEAAIRECLTSRYPRSSFVLANKLSETYFQKEEEIRPLFQLQLELCGVDYFDFYLMHAMSAARHEKMKALHAYETVQALKAEGKIRHVGFSFHDSPAILEQILNDCPEMEFVQLQFNYVDYEDTRVEARKCYEVCQKYGKPVFVMEPVKGGRLVELPKEALALLQNGSPASYALRFAASFPGVAMVLSGMSTEAQVEDNLTTMGDFIPLTEQEHALLAQVRTLYQAQHKIPCTGCRYCVDGCPAGIPIPEVFAAVNKKLAGEEAEGETELAGWAEQCLSCGQCEAACPQHLHIPALLQETEKFLENFRK